MLTVSKARLNFQTQKSHINTLHNFFVFFSKKYVKKKKKFQNFFFFFLNLDYF